MHVRLQHLVFAALVVSLVSLAYGINYFYLSDCETTPFGDRIRFWTPDTIEGPVHSNGLLAIEGTPQFYASVTTSECDFWRGPGYNPGFHGPLPQFCAPRVEIPHRAQELRNCAMIQSMFFADMAKSYRVHLRGDSALVSRWWTGTPFDSTDSWLITLPRGRCIFFDGPLDIEGHMSGEASIGTACDLRLLDNVVYDDADSLTGRTPLTSINYLMLVSEHDIKIANTPANGRENSNGEGLSQPDRNLSGIVISAALVALGESFTFEQQNDVDSGYVYQIGDPPQPAQDDRGTVYLYGSLAQMRRGYVHRSSNMSTGYAKQYRWDRRFAAWMPPGALSFDAPRPRTTDTLDFGTVPVGRTVWDTARVYLNVVTTLGAVTATPPFYATRVPPFDSSSFHIPARFTPTHTGQYSGILYIYTPAQSFQIVLRGRGMPGGNPSPMVFDVSPNPFNLTTTLHYSLSDPGEVTITLFDVLGRSVKQIDLLKVEAGAHDVSLSADGLATGVYFVRLQSGQQMAMKKLLLLK
ncbi:MAG TPA: T9SS type A sorting domain-containing protein [bacterium]|jgi:hypothetical protein